MQIAASHGAHNTHGHRLTQAERIAYSENVVADLQTFGVANDDGLQVGGVDLQDRDVGLGIGTNDTRFEFATIREGDADVGGAVYDVVVGYDIALRSHDNSRAEAFGTTLLRNIELAIAALTLAHTPITEKLTEERAHIHVVAIPLAHRHTGLDHLGRRNTHDCGKHLLHHRSEGDPAGRFLGTSELQGCGRVRHAHMIGADERHSTNTERRRQHYDRRASEESLYFHRSSRKCLV